MFRQSATSAFDLKPGRRAAAATHSSVRRTLASHIQVTRHVDAAVVVRFVAVFAVAVASLIQNEFCCFFLRSTQTIPELCREQNHTVRAMRQQIDVAQ